MKKVVILSGGMDSTISLIHALFADVDQHTHTPHEVYALSFDYKQKQSKELEMAHRTCIKFDVPHKIVDISFLGDMSVGFSANVTGTEIKMPTIREVIGDPRPVTYVPNRNAVMLMIAAAFAETMGAEEIYTGLQARDEYNYHDTTPEFVDHLNAALDLNRKQKIRIVAPFNGATKAEEIEWLIETIGYANAMDVLKDTISCYNPGTEGNSCGKCPTCAERIKAFMSLGFKDPIPYVININW